MAAARSELCLLQEVQAELRGLVQHGAPAALAVHEPAAVQHGQVLGTALGVTPSRRASAVVAAGERSVTSSRARAGPSSSSKASQAVSEAAVTSSHTVAVPRAG